MNILHYDLTNYDVDAIAEVVRYMNSNGLEVIAIPKDFDLLLDCDTFTLNLIKQKIEEAIRKKEIIGEM
jgi:hypothetical protein